jgi:mandelate racemase
VATSIEIKSVRIRTALVPFRRPIHTSVGLFEKGPFLLIDLESKGGAVGRLPGFTFSPLGLKLVPPVIEHLVDALKGRPIAPHELPAIHDGLQKRLTLLGHEGVVQMAISMLDMVLHDCMAQANGVPLYRLLGAPRRATPAYNSCGLGIMAPEKLAIEARELAAEHGGYNHVKMRLGRGTLPDELTAIRAVREAVGPGVLVSVDFNQALPAAMALPACRTIDGLGLGWIEEPVVYDDYDTQRRLAGKLSTPLQVGENWWSWRVGRTAIEKGACDYVMPDILRIGGVTGWMRLARVAELNAIPFSSHLTPEYSVHVLAATPTAHWLEWMDWAVPLLADPLLPEKGSLAPRDTPGAGIAWNEPAIAPLLVTV